jgi:hypothetical protein
MRVPASKRLDTPSPCAYIAPVSVTVEPPGKVWTEAELQSLLEEGYNHELVDGELITSPENDFL